jgi:hypothetical protein
MTSFDIYNRDQTLQADQPVDGLTSFDVYGKPPPPASPPPPVGYAEDIAKGTAGGLGRGVAGTVGLPGTVGSLVRAGLGKAGISDENLDRGSTAVRTLGMVVPGLRLLQGPDAGDVQKGMESVTGKFYEPKTIPGQYASTIAEFAPGALVPGGGAGSVAKSIGAKVLNIGVPAITSETAGQFTKDTPYEPWARLAGGVGGGVATSKAITPFGLPSKAYQRSVDVLEKEGIPLTAGQRTGSKPLQWFESNAADMPLIGGQAQRLQTNATDALARAVTERMFDPTQLAKRGVPEGTHLPDPSVFAHGRQSLKDEYNRLSSANQLRSDPQLVRDLHRAESAYEANVLPSQRTADITHTKNDLIDNLIAGQGQMPGDVYQSQRSRLDRAAKGMQDPERANALRDMKTALDDAMERGLSPRDAVAWQLNNRRYANMKQVGVPLAAAGGETISPLKLAQHARSGRAEQYAAQQGNMDELANAAAAVMKPLPQSGTAPRLNASQLFQGGSGGAIGALLGGPVGAAIGVAAPFIPPWLATTALGQKYLANRALPQNIRDIITQTMAEQAISQPSGVERNQTARDEYEKKRKLPRVYVMEK